MATKRDAPAFGSWTPRIALAAAFASWLLVGGCDKPKKAPRVSGQLLVNGRPAGGAYVMFHASDGLQGRPSLGSARTKEDGSFSLSAQEPGEYAVTLFWPRVVGGEGEVVEGRDRFNGRYRNPQRPVLKVAIHEGENALPPIELAFP